VDVASDGRAALPAPLWHPSSQPHPRGSWLKTRTFLGILEGKSQPWSMQGEGWPSELKKPARNSLLGCSSLGRWGRAQGRGAVPPTPYWAFSWQRSGCAAPAGLTARSAVVVSMEKPQLGAALHSEGPGSTSPWFPQRGRSAQSCIIAKSF